MRGRWGSSLLPPPASRLPPTPPAPLTSSKPGPPPAPSPRRPGAPPARPRARPLAWRLLAGLAQPGPFSPRRTLGSRAARPASLPGLPRASRAAPPAPLWLRSTSWSVRALQLAGSVRPLPPSSPPVCDRRLAGPGTFLSRNWGACFAPQPDLDSQWPTLRVAPGALR